MMLQKYLFKNPTMFFLLFCASFCSGFFMYELFSLEYAEHQKGRLEIVIIQSDLGWGYQIVKDKKIVIHQPFIPAVSGNKAFLTKKQAFLTANLVADKMQKGKIPTIHQKELDSLGILYYHGLSKLKN